MHRTASRLPAILAGIVLAFGLGTNAARAENAMFTFGEMLELQALPADATKRTLSQEEVILYQNMEFYVVTVFETLIAANNAAIKLHDEAMFCAPAGAFQFRDGADITGLARFVTDELLALSKQIGGTAERFHDRPASEVLLLGLRAACPCTEANGTLSAMR